MPEKPQWASRPLSLAALSLVLAMGLVFDAVLAHQLIKRHQRRVMQAQPAQEMRLTVPGEGVCPAWPHWDPHQGRRERLTVGITMSSAACPPAARQA